METNTASDLELLVPQKLLAVTVISPSVEPTVGLIDVVVELPLHPEGKVQVYEAAPKTGEML